MGCLQIWRAALIMRVRFFERPTEVNAVDNFITMPSPMMLAVDAATVAVVAPVHIP
jgi:hypothetical protein